MRGVRLFDGNPKEIDAQCGRPGAKRLIEAGERHSTPLREFEIGRVIGGQLEPG